MKKLRRVNARCPLANISQFEGDGLAAVVTVERVRLLGVGVHR